jgi:phosphate transport system substrate-binding protein
MPAGGDPLVISTPESMTYLLSFWLVEFKRGQAMTTRIDTADSDAVARALVEGRAKLGAMSRRMSEQEVREFQARHARQPLEVRVALDGMAVYVHKDNPLRGLRIAEIDGIFSTTRKCGHGENIAWWDQVGLKEAWRLRQIELYGSHPSSSVRAVFADTALCGGTYKATLEFAPSANELLRLVAKNPAAIAYGPANVDAQLARTVRVLPISANDTSYVSPTPDSLAAGRYPLARFLYIYAVTEHDGRLSARQRAFLDSALSPHGQSFVGLNGYVALPPALASEERAKLQ